MAIRQLLTICVLAAFAAACSQDSQKNLAAMPTSPSAVTSIPTDGDFVSRPAVVGFPPRADGVDFRAQLENKYVAMGRRPSQVYVDPDGEATWVGEYYRYRVNGCDHNTAISRVMTQVDGGAPGPICSVLAFPETAVYPPREEVVDFRRQLGTKYQGMGRSAQSAVDPEGAAIWLGEYYRYRTSGCDHATATQKVMTQVDGNAAPASCVVACAYFVQTPITIPSGAGAFSADLRRTSGSCDWVALTDTPWITLNPPIVGTDRTIQSYTVAENTGQPRWGQIRFVYPGGITYLDINQGAPSYSLAFQLFDPAVSSTTPTLECAVRTTTTICTLSAATSKLPPSVTTYDWQVEYAYNGSKLKTQVGALNTFSFTESCGASPAEGAPVSIKVTLKVSDPAGNSATVFSGQGTQPSLQLRTFSCP
jgi:hypothetical protein